MLTVKFTAMILIIFLLGHFVSTKFTLVGPCECGIFLANSFSTMNSPPSRVDNNSTTTPILTHTIIYNNCDIVGERMCRQLCTSVNKMSRAEDIDTLCKAIGDGANIMLKLQSKHCGEKWISTNLIATEPLCCSEGQDVECEKTES